MYTPQPRKIRRTEKEEESESAAAPLGSSALAMKASVVRGPRGPKGDKGEKGERGPRGGMGPMGPRGEFLENKNISCADVTASGDVSAASFIVPSDAHTGAFAMTSSLGDSTNAVDVTSATGEYKVPFGSTPGSVDDGFSDTDYEYTTPSSGIYHVTFTMNFQGDSGSSDSDLYLKVLANDGSDSLVSQALCRPYSIVGSNNSAYVQYTVSCLYKAAASGEKIFARVDSNADVSFRYAQAGTSLTVYRVART